LASRKKRLDRVLEASACVNNTAMEKGTLTMRRNANDREKQTRGGKIRAWENIYLTFKKRDKIENSKIPRPPQMTPKGTPDDSQ
jgi:hypothetical protein